MSEPQDTDIAIVGMGLRVPGASDYRTFWRNLRDGVESIERYSDEQLLAAGEDPELLRLSNYVRAGAPLPGMENFDGEFFGFSPKECAILDPQHRHFLECAWEALEDAGHPPETFDGPIGVFAGCGMGSYFYFNLCSNPDLVRNVGMFLLRHTGNDKDFLATRLSYLLNLTGPSVNVQTACSTSLVAIHLASQSLMAGECDLAIAGGVTIELPHRRGYVFRENEILSPDGHCHAFDHRAQGTLFGSGTGVVVLRQLGAALRDGDHIHAVIRGSAVNNDGARKAGYLAPSVDGQAAAVVEALTLAGVDADTIEYVECHGTGTYLGDPIEVAALTRAFKQSTDKRGFCRIGSVKTNIGHLDTAAGVVSLTKAVLSLENKQIPPSLNFDKPNPTIDFEGSPFVVNAALHPWQPRGKHPRRAGVNSLGVGGTNAYVVLEEAPARPAAAASKAPYQLLCLSARNRQALDDGCERLAAHLERHPDLDLADVAYSLKVGRRAFNKRRVLAARDRDEAIALLRTRDQGRVYNHSALEGGVDPAVFFMFPGGGAQYVNMARDLYQSDAGFRETVDRGLRCLAPRNDYDLKEVMFPSPDKIDWAKQRFQKPSVQLPAIFIVEYALARLLMSRGINPKGLIGHSLGENTAACLAEVFTFEEGVGLVHLRGTLFDSVPAGGMLSVPLAPEQVRPFLGTELDLACVNGPNLCVVSGPSEPLADAQRRMKDLEVEAQRIPIDIAAHSRMLEGILEPFGKYLRSLRLRAPKIPFISNRTGKWITEEQATDPSYWVQHLRHTVHFADGISTLAQDPGAVFVEVGPGKTLGSLSKQNPAVSAQTVVNTLRHPEEQVDDRAFLATVFGRLWAIGLPMPADRLWPGEKRRRVPLPTYAFQGQRYWIEPSKAVAQPAGSTYPPKIEDFEQWFYSPVWRRQDADGDQKPEKRSWLIFLDETGLGDELVERVRASGEDVVTVQPGDAFYKVSDQEYWLSPEHGSDGYQALVRDLLASGKAPNRIVHMWLLSDGESFRPGSNFLHRNQERGFYSLLFLAQALSGEDYPRPLHLDVVSRGMQKVANEPLMYPDQATVLGPVKVIPRELPGVTCRSIDLAPLPRAAVRALHTVADMVRSVGVRVPMAGQGANGVGALDALLGEILLPPESLVVALRGDERWLQRYERLAVPDGGPTSVALRRGGVYLVTGGLGGIGLTVARTLAREYQARLVLIGRSGLPPRAEWDQTLSEHPTEPVSNRIRAVQGLEALGSEVLVAGGDVADADRMAEVVAEAKLRFGAINGVVHAAGVLDDALIPAKRQASVEQVFGPKVYGTLALDRVLAKEPLDFFLLFSSTSTASAAAGQVDYVAANTFLDNFARKARGEGRPVISLAWGVWQGVGMAASAAEKMGLGAGENGANAAPSYPLFDARRLQGRTNILQGVLSPQRSWFLDQHRTAPQRHAILPGTAYIELVRAALREIGETQPFEIEDLYFFRSLYVPDDHPREVRIRLKPSDEGYLFELQSKQTIAEGADMKDPQAPATKEPVVGWLLHSQASVRIGPEVKAKSPTVDLAAVEARCRVRRTVEDRSGLRSKQEDHLNFGPRWRVLHQAFYGETEALGRLALPEAFVADLAQFGLHPGLLDIATGFALELDPGYQASKGSDLWVPISYKRIRVLGDLPPKIFSWMRNTRRQDGVGTFASFDITLTDEKGNVVLEVEELTMRRLEGNLVVDRPPRPSEIEKEARGTERELSPAELAFRHGLEQGISPADGMRALKRVLSRPDQPQVIVTSMDLRGLIQQAGALAEVRVETETKFSRPQLESEYLAPRNDIEKTLVALWEGLLGVNQVGVKDNFFELGGHSLIAVRLFAKIKKTYGVDYPISVLFEAPTIEGCAKMIASVIGDTPPETAGAHEPHRTRYTHLVPMHSGNGSTQPKTPFFLVAGMFGNVLNLRHLAQLVGTDRPFYGLQARGLYGDHQPHETFEEMARDYIAELRTVQPHGPYLIGGFSGGGITAYEIGRQLREQGEEVALLVFLDTPLPKDQPLSLKDKLTIHQQNLTKQGPMYAVNWLKEKRQYKVSLKVREQKLKAQEQDKKGHDFHSQVVEAAFYRALEKYELEPQPFDVVLFRPKLQPAHQLGPGRAINIHRRFIYHDNGWTPIVKRVDVFEVPGDHDSMVLEPNVRVLAAKLRQCIEAAEQAHQAGKDRDQGTGNGAGEGRREAEANGEGFGAARTAPAMA